MRYGACHNEMFPDHRGSSPSLPAWTLCSLPSTMILSQSPGPDWLTHPPSLWRYGEDCISNDTVQMFKCKAKRRLTLVDALGIGQILYKPGCDESLFICRFSDLMVSCHELDSWTQDFVLPAVVWLSGLFNPQSFLTGEIPLLTRSR